MTNLSFVDCCRSSSYGPSSCRHRPHRFVRIAEKIAHGQRAILDQVSAGKLSIEDADRMINWLTDARKLIETRSLENRVSAMEDAVAQVKSLDEHV